MTIRLRLAIAFGAGILLTLAVAAAVVWWQMGLSLRASLETALGTRAAGVITYIENNGQAGLQESDRAAPGVFAVLFAPDGKLIDASSDAPPGVRPAAGVQAIGGRQYLVRTETASDGTIVVTGSDLQTVADAQATLERALLGAGLTVGVVSLLGSWFLSGRALRPLSRLTGDAAALDPADLDRRLSQPARMDEVGRLTVTLNAMLDRIAESVRRQRMFVAMASHELRTPLASLRAGLDIADRDDARSGEYRKALREAQGDVIRLTSLTTSLLELASTTSDSGSVARSLVSLRDLVTTVVREIEPLAQRYHATLELVVSDAVVCVDRTRMEHALGNLVTNAIVHGGAGPVRIECAVEGTSPDQVLRAEVLDRGSGLGGDAPAELFEPFRRGSEVRADGSGLGLATVAGAVLAHGGTYGAANRDGGGARFWLAVPCEAASAAIEVESGATA
jgi:two-component system OmpR family sensor kinase